MSLRVTNKEQVLASIADGLDDLYFLGQPPEDIDVVATPIIVLAAPDQPLADKKNISLQRLALKPWLMREKNSGTRIAIERRFAEHGITLHPRLELGSSEALKQAILAGLGISALSRHALSLNQPGQFAVLARTFLFCATGTPSIRPGGSYRWWRGRFSIICWGGAIRRLLHRAKRNKKMAVRRLEDDIVTYH